MSMVTSIPSLADTVLRGAPVVPGVAYGPVVRVQDDVPQEAIDAFGAGPEDAVAALAAYDTAVETVAEGYSAKSGQASGAAAEVLVASAGLARDKGMRKAVRQRLQAGEGLVASVRGAADQFVDAFTAMGGLMAERTTDLRDIEKRVVARVVGAPEPGVPDPDQPSIVVADDLAPADTAGLDPERVLALVTTRGGPTSHTAIIARQLGIPCVVGVPGAHEVPDGTHVLVDGTGGTVELEPDAAEARDRVAQDREVRDEAQAWAGPGATADGTAVKLLANVADGESARGAAPQPVEGVGLFRTELCFLGRAEEPTVEEQADIYAEVLEAFAGREVVLRTLDAGSDKPLAFATLAGEENPALGVRGLRLSFADPGLLDRQLDAVAQAAASTGARVRVMAPMVATVAEATDFAAKVRERGLVPGVMVEVPSVALLADRLLEVVDFLSIGTNDLTQYTMAADRMATDLAHLTDPWQPAVLRLVSMTAQAGKRAGKPVGVCGEAAADPLLACVLVGMGITSLSMAAAAVRPVGARLARAGDEACRRAAEVALAAPDPAAGRAEVLAVLEQG